MAGRSPSQLVLLNGLLAGAFFAFGWLGHSIGFSELNVSPIWPPTGLALFAVWHGGAAFFPGIFLGGILIAYVGGAPIAAAAITGAGNVVSACMANRLLRWGAFHPSLGQWRDVLLLLAATLTVPFVGASIGLASLILTASVALEQWLRLGILWWMGDAVGFYLVAPFLFAWRTRPAFLASPWRVAELLLALAGMALINLLVARQDHGTAYIFFPFLIWLALRFFQPGATLAMVVLAVLTVLTAIADEGPFAYEDPFQKAIRMQLFIGVAAATTHLLAAGALERRRNESIRLKNAALEAARHEAETGRQRFAFLAEVSRVLSQSLDYETTLRNIVRLAVPRLADHAVAAIVNEDGSLRYVESFCPGALEHETPRIETRQGCHVDSGHLVMRAVQARQVVLATNQGEEETGAAEEHLIVPLASDEGLGLVICWTLAASGRKYTPSDIALAEEVRTRADIAVENARLYQDAQKAVALRNEFLSVAAHELKTPVTSLLGFSQFALRQLERPPPDLEKVSLALQTVESQSKKLSMLIGQLLDVSRIESGKLALEAQPIGLRAFLEGLLHQTSAQLGDRPVTLSGPNILVYGDALRLEQVFINLLTNAVKFTPPKSPIEVMISGGSEVAVSVCDHGPGIPAGELPFVFDRFYQGQAGSAQGMGLGLYISQQIALMHGGMLTADLPSGGGSRFTLTLPATAPKGPNHQTSFTLEGRSENDGFAF